MISVILISWAFGSRIFSAVYRATGSPSGWLKPLLPLVPRGVDSYGGGGFGASRDGGSRKHRGQDYLAAPGRPVYAPFDGVATTGSAYADGSRAGLRRVRVTAPGGTVYVSLMYVEPNVVNGEAVTAGQVVGFSQSLQPYYPGIRDHVHVEVVVAGVHVDPLPYWQPTPTGATV